MNKISCNAVKDLLPLFIDNAVSEATKKEVAEHLKLCETCRSEYELLKKEVPLPANSDVHLESAQALQNMKRKLLRKRILTSIISVALTLALSVSAWWGLTQYCCIPLEPDEITAVAYQFQDGSICVTTTTTVMGFASRVTYVPEEKALYEILTREIIPRRASESYSEQDILNGQYSGGSIILDPVDPATIAFYTGSQNGSIEAYYIGNPGSDDVKLMWKKGMELPDAPQWAEEKYQQEVLN